METLAIAIISFFLGLVATWFSARLNKSNDTKTQLLLEIDEWVSKMTLLCSTLNVKSPYFHRILRKNGELELNDEYWNEIFREAGSLQNTYRSLGIAKALGNEELFSLVDTFSDKVWDFSTKWGSLVLTDSFSPELIKEITELSSLTNENGFEIHRIIAEELIRVYPSWTDKLIAKIKSWF